jgi:prepilin-type N-terminal cleavage/methylation domain-containing protein
VKPGRSSSEAAQASDAGFTLIELLVASAMGVVVLGAVGTMMIGAIRSQPEISARAQNISSARWVLERFTREIRNGVAVNPAKATASEVSFRTYVRRTSCGSGAVPSSTTPAIECQVTYKCTTTYCTRGEGAPGSSTPVSEQKIFSGIDDSNVFTYSPSAAEPTYIGITLHIPNPSGPADITVSDGASLRNATLGY